MLGSFDCKQQTTGNKPTPVEPVAKHGLTVSTLTRQTLQKNVEQEKTPSNVMHSAIPWVSRWESIT